MAWTQSQLDTLEEAIASGQLSVEYRDRKVTYRSIEDMMKLRAQMREQLGHSDSLADRARYAKTSKDL